MRLPGRNRVVVSERKLTGYLLSPTHPSGRHKATWLTGLGFTPESWRTLEEAIRRHAATHDVTSAEQSPFGTRYVIQGRLVTEPARPFSLVHRDR